MAVEILVGMNTIDGAIATAGSAEDIFAFCALNGIAITADLVPGEVLQGTGLTYRASSAVPNSQVVSKPVAVLQGQTLLDVAIQQLGSAEGVFGLYRMNAISVTAALVPGAVVNYSLTPVSAPVAKIYADNGYKPQSGTVAAPVQLGGIGYWAIELTFVAE